MNVSLLCSFFLDACTSLCFYQTELMVYFTARNLHRSINIIWLTSVSSGLPLGSTGKESTCNVGDLGSIPRLGRSPGEGKDDLLQYSGLENSMNCIVHGVTESDMTERLSFQFCLLCHLYIWCHLRDLIL